MLVGTLNDCKVFIVDDRKEVFKNTKDPVYYIYKNKVYKHGKYIGNFDRKTNAVTWLAELEETTPQDTPDRKCDYCHTIGDHDWKAMLKPVDDMIKEMLEREL